MTDHHVAEPASQDVHLLAEGPFWDAPRHRLLWVDVDAGQVHQGSLTRGTVHATGVVDVDRTVGAVVPDEQGRLLVAGTRALHVVETDGRVRPGVHVLPDGVRSRLNDGACDPAGRFVVGSMALDDRTGQEQLVVVHEATDLRPLDEDLTLSNGLAWTADGRRLYSTDTAVDTIYVRDYDPATGTAGPRSVHLKVTDGSPDGMCLDADGDLWVAVWGAGEVRCYSAADGSVLATVAVAAPHTSSVAFAGPDLDVLVITTGSSQLTPEQARDHPDSGRLFTAHVGVAGAPVPGWDPVSHPVLVPAGPPV